MRKVELRMNEEYNYKIIKKELLLHWKDPLDKLIEW